MTACSTSPRFFRRACRVLVIVALQCVTLSQVLCQAKVTAGSRFDLDFLRELQVVVSAHSAVKNSQNQETLTAEYAKGNRGGRRETQSQLTFRRHLRL